MRDAKKDLAICEAAASGPWEYVWQYTYTNCPWTIQAQNSRYWVCSLPQRGFETVGNPDAEFIITAREALPHWINRTVAAEARAKRLEKDLREAEVRTKMAEAREMDLRQNIIVAILQLRVANKGYSGWMNDALNTLKQALERDNT